MRGLRLAASWLSYLINAKSTHGVHSPFVFNLVRDIIYGNAPLNLHRDIEKIRQDLLKDQTPIQLTDFGAGAGGKKISERTISAIASSAATSPKHGRLLSRLSHSFGKGTILETGTSLGLGTLYLAAGSMNSTIITLEGDPNIARIAEQNFKKAGINLPLQKVGPFLETIPQVLKNHPSIDLLYLDGDHRKSSTLTYFEMLLPALHNDSLVIVDDIRWSDDMQQAWQELIRHPRVTVSIDLFFKGLLFFRKEQPREHFLIRF